MGAIKMVEATRDVSAVAVPAGTNVTLKKGTWLTVRQALGGTWTVTNDYGEMFRISSNDADVIGETPVDPATLPVPEPAKSAGELESWIWDQLRTCYDPEIPVNIVDLGLVYSVLVEPLPESSWKVDVKMTLTAPGCGMGEVLKNDAEMKIGSLAGVKESRVEIVTEPAWNPSMMTEAARLQLNMF
jgi:probable FeS assembly SUF system protein SufT